MSITHIRRFAFLWAAVLGLAASPALLAGDFRAERIASNPALPAALSADEGIASAPALPAALSASAQRASGDLVSAFVSSLQGRRAEFRYEMTMDKLLSDGTVVLQGMMYRLAGNGLEVWSDGAARWSLDRSGKELLIESVAGVGVEANPILFLSCLEEAFSRRDLGTKTFDGSPCRVFQLTPSEGNGSLTAVLLYFRNGTPCGAELSMKDGHRARILLSGLRLLDAEPVSAFRFNPSSLDRSFVVTDLR